MAGFPLKLCRLSSNLDLSPARVLQTQTRYYSCLRWPNPGPPSISSRPIPPSRSHLSPSAPRHTFSRPPESPVSCNLYTAHTGGRQGGGACPCIAAHLRDLGRADSGVCASWIRDESHPLEFPPSRLSTRRVEAVDTVSAVNVHSIAGDQMLGLR